MFKNNDFINIFIYIIDKIIIIDNYLEFPKYQISNNHEIIGNNLEKSTRSKRTKIFIFFIFFKYKTTATSNNHIVKYERTLIYKMYSVMSLKFKF